MYRATQMKELQMAAYDYWTPEHARRQMLDRLRRKVIHIPVEKVE